MPKASIGSISTGTLRTEDLLDSFVYELSRIDINHDHSELCAEANAWIDLEDDTEDKAYKGSELVNELIDALNEFAPPYCYFGSHEGDGADFGFWPCWKVIEELPQVQDSDEAKALGEDCKFMNDHGNVTIYDGDGEVIWDCV